MKPPLELMIHRVAGIDELSEDLITAAHLACAGAFTPFSSSEYFSPAG